MSFFAILFALLIEQIRPVGRGNLIHGVVRRWVAVATRNFDTGSRSHGWFVMALAVGGPTAVAAGVHWLLLAAIGWPAAMLWTTVLLYYTLGFRHFSHHFTGLRDALLSGDEGLARQLLARWQRVDVSQLPPNEIVRHVIRYSVLAAHRHVFGVLACYACLALLGFGPAGAVLYRVAEFAPRYWKHRARQAGQAVSDGLRTAAAQFWHVLDWLPARFTALGFAVVGSFEDAIDAWRAHGAAEPQDTDGLMIAATSGALGIALAGEPLAPLTETGPFDMSRLAATVPNRAFREPVTEHLAQVVGLVWRTVVMWMVLLGILTLGSLLG